MIYEQNKDTHFSFSFIIVEVKLKVLDTYPSKIVLLIYLQFSQVSKAVPEHLI